ncbi:uncharacterized protein CDAR_44031 [Caerostris darwini]|uniref:Uncharacterized protein n=1 Tax=Caerostris darwini TaxID=1538125 RepID=A0AAV4RNI6_9ARAC|nr:uncharacterized protein CDAR_44031 [Caerostris darwini]
MGRPGKQLTVWQYCRQVFSVSGVNGVSHVALARSGGRRLLWTALFAVGVMGWLYQTTALLDYYYRYPSVVKIQVEKPTVMDFPALTLCNVNRIRRSVYCREFPDNCKLHDVELTEDEIFNLTLGFQRQGRKAELGHQLKDMLVGLLLLRLSPTRHLRLHQVLQPAVRSPPGQLLRVLVRRRTEAQAVRHGAGRMAGQERWVALLAQPPLISMRKNLLIFRNQNCNCNHAYMELVFNVERDEYLDQDEAPGLIVTLHEDMGMPHVLAHGVHVHAEHTYSLSIEKESVNLLSDPFASNCTDFRQLPFRSVHSMELSPRMCTVECLLFHQKRECGHNYVTDNVVLYSERMPYDPQQVTPADRDCADRLSKDFRDFCRSLCSVPCHETHYPVVIDSSPTSPHKMMRKEEDLETYRRRRGEDKKSVVSVGGAHPLPDAAAQDLQPHAGIHGRYPSVSLEGRSYCSATWAASRVDGWASPFWSSAHSWRGHFQSSGSPWGCAAASPTAVPPPRRRRVLPRGALRQPRTRNATVVEASSWAYRSPVPKRAFKWCPTPTTDTPPCSKQRDTSLDTMMIVKFL